MSKIKVYTCGSDKPQPINFILTEQNYPQPVESHELTEINYFKDHQLNGVKSIAAGMSYSALIDSNGILYTWGQLNVSQTTKEKYTQEPKIGTYFTSKNIVLKQVSTMNEHAAVVSEDGNVFIWGNNSFHHFPSLDNSDDILIDNPSMIKLSFKANSVSCGGYFTMILSVDGSIWINGVNNQNELGFDWNSPFSTQTIVQNPQQLSPSFFNNKKIIQIAAGWSHAAALSQDGSVYTWGKSSTGRLGRNSTRKIDLATFDQNIKIKFITCGHNDTYAIDVNGKIYGAGLNEGGQHGSNIKQGKRTMKILNNEGRIQFCSSGSDHSIIILGNRSIKVAGSNKCAKLSLNVSQCPFTTVFLPILSNEKGLLAAAGFNHSLFVTIAS